MELPTEIIETCGTCQWVKECFADLGDWSEGEAEEHAINTYTYKKHPLREQTRMLGEIGEKSVHYVLNSCKSLRSRVKWPLVLCVIAPYVFVFVFTNL
jgi:hypothetical protein